MPDDPRCTGEAGLFADHSRQLAENRYVYAVVSRRSGGVSIGVNLSPTKRCVFRCIYCQVVREGAARTQPDDEPDCASAIDLAVLRDELTATIRAARGGSLFDQPRFAAVPDRLRRLNDIALSGDGEPTACPQFPEVVELLGEVRRQAADESLKLVLITNAALLHLPRVRRGLELFDALGGQVWAKLDAGTEAYYRRVARSRIPWEQILRNVRETACRRPIIIQTLMMTIDGRGPDEAETRAYIDRLRDILDCGGRIEAVQLHTVARRPAEANVGPISSAELQRMADRIREETPLTVLVFA